MLSLEKLSILDHFSTLEDPRIDRHKKHSLINIITISICATMSGAENWVDMQDYGLEKKEWLSTFLELENGTPSHDTFRRVFSLIDTTKFQKCYTEWINAISQSVNSEHVAIDGKTLRRSFDLVSAIKPLHLVSAWSSASSFILAQLPVDDKSNEITAIPKLLDMLCIRGCIFTIDAIGAQKKIAKQIVEKGGDYIFGLKDNNKNLHKEAKEFFARSSTAKFIQKHKDVDADHGRIETRECFSASAALFRKTDAWDGMQSVVMIKSTREINGKESAQHRFFISSLDETDPKLLADTIRNHWGIENTLHWNLDMNFAEDSSRVREKTSAQNLALLRRIIVGLFKNEDTEISIRRKIRKACMDNNFMLRVLGVQPQS